MTDFTQFNLPPALMDTLTRMGYTAPTPVQLQALPPALEGKDILGSAQTGTGKTAAYGIPLITKLMSNPRGAALIMTPTRELATQVMSVLKKMLGERNPIQTALLIGGESMGPQFQQLRNRPRLIVGTPGRINDHLERGTLMLHDAGFPRARRKPTGCSTWDSRCSSTKSPNSCPRRARPCCSRATLPHNIVKLSEKYLTNPVRIQVGEERAVAVGITHAVVHTTDANKYELLLKELAERQGTVIIFVKTKRGADRLATRLNKQHLSADAIHGDLKQSKRDRVIAAFRDKKHRILVATDVAARGLDIPHIEHVINFDLPHAPEDYIHRIGRTARAGALGAAVCFVSPDDAGKWRDIQRLMDPNAVLAPQPHQDRGAPRSGFRSRRNFHSRRPARPQQHARAIPA